MLVGHGPGTDPFREKYFLCQRIILIVGSLVDGNSNKIRYKKVFTHIYYKAISTGMYTS